MDIIIGIFTVSIIGIFTISLLGIYFIQSWILKGMLAKQKTLTKISVIILTGLTIIGLILGAVITFNIEGLGIEWGPLFAMMGAGIMSVVWLVGVVIHGFQGNFK